jgi:hypothetical protein
MHRNYSQVLQVNSARRGIHCEQFATLETKLNEESSKLVNFMGKSVGTEPTKKDFKLAISTSICFSM